MSTPEQLVTGEKFERIPAGDWIYFFGFYQPVIIKVEPIYVSDPKYNFELQPGQYIEGIGGKKKSAGYPNTYVTCGYALKYLGTLQAERFKLVIFNALSQKNPETLVIHKKAVKYQQYYYGWITLDEQSGLWFTHNRSNAGRIIQTELLDKKS